MVKILLILFLGIFMFVFLIINVIYVLLLLGFVDEIVRFMWFFCVNFIVLNRMFYNIWWRCVLFILIRWGSGLLIVVLSFSCLLVVSRWIMLLSFLVKFFNDMVFRFSLSLFLFNLLRLIILLKILFNVIVLVYIVFI